MFGWVTHVGCCCACGGNDGDDSIDRQPVYRINRFILAKGGLVGQKQAIAAGQINLYQFRFD